LLVDNWYHINIRRVLITGYLRWWYSTGIIESWRLAESFLAQIGDFFSLSMLVRTWLSPWKNDTSAAGSSGQSLIKVWENNLASRFVGFFVRTIVIVVALIVLGTATLGMAIVLLLWLFVPWSFVVIPAVAAVIVNR
jgi:hypothetical protein